MKTKQVFNERIDMFIESFSDRFKDIENAEIMRDKDKTPTSFSDESKKIQKTVEEMRVMHS